MKKFFTLLMILATTIMLISCAKAVKTSFSTASTEGLKDSTADKMETAKEPESENKDPGLKDIQAHTGVFELTMSGYKGEMIIEYSEEKLSGTIKFFNWGNGTPQPLTDLRITENKIYFKRIIRTKEDLVNYGGTAYFEQDFYGIFSEDKKKIKGYYRYAGTQDGWKADKKK